MCGISGILSKHLTETEFRFGKALLTYQQHRGPDFQALEHIQTQRYEILLGHNRLKIIDLSDEANQPFWDSTQRYCITYNGEIYNYQELRSELLQLNYRFSTNSDTEVIVVAFKEWGINALNRFNGAFAFALYDQTQHKLWLCRDRFGKKPLFYCSNKGQLYFASSAARLAKYFNRAPNLIYAATGLRYWFYEDDSGTSPYEDVLALPAGHYLEINLNQIPFQTKLTEYYNLEAQVVARIADTITLTPKGWQSLITETLNNAISIRLRADVPLGVALSGGLDSSLVARIVKKNHDSVVGYSFGHPSALYTEAPLVEKMAQHSAITPHYIWPPVEEYTDALFKTLDAQEAPFTNPSVIGQYLVYHQAKTHGIKILLGGQGSDELFMGYRKFQLFWLKHLLHTQQIFQSVKFLWYFSRMLFSELHQIKHYWQHLVRYQSNSSENPLLHLPPPPHYQLGCSKDTNGLFKRQLLDVKRYSLPTLLRYEDRNSMGNSVESRLPFLDYRLVELGLALPTILKLNKGYGKWILRAIAHGKIPDSIRLARYKRGFDINLYHVFQNSDFGENLRNALDQYRAHIKDYMHPEINIKHAFSDQALLKRHNAFGEMITLLWLGRYLSEPSVF